MPFNLNNTILFLAAQLDCEAATVHKHGLKFHDLEVQVIKALLRNHISHFSTKAEIERNLVDAGYWQDPTTQLWRGSDEWLDKL